MKVSVILAAAGSSTRMGTDKQLLPLKGIPVLARTMLAFESTESVMEILVSVPAGQEKEISRLAQTYGITKFKAAVAGGKTRQESVLAALNHISKETSLIAIHDGARPLIKPENIEQVCRDAEVFGGAALGVPVKDTIKVVHDGLVTDTPPRQFLYAMQTPQVFQRKLYFEAAAFAKAHDLDFTDDCQLAEAIGVKICVTKGDYRNLKLTTPEDLKIAEALLEGEEP